MAGMLIPYTRCADCGKRGYYTKAEARRAKKLNRDGHMSVYQCYYQERFWHIGHLPNAVINGNATRDDIFVPQRARAS